MLLNNQSTLHDTTISVRCPAGGALVIYWGDGTASVVTCNGVLNAYVHTYVSTGYYTIQVVGTTTLIVDFRCYSQAWIGGDLGAATRGFGPALTTLYLNTTSVSGDIAVMSRFPALVSVFLSATTVAGNIAALAGITSLVQIYLHATGVSGDIASLAGLTNLLSLSIWSTPVVGDVASLAPLNKLTILYVHQLPSLTYTTPTALPAWPAAIIWFYSSGLSSAEVDGFLIDFAAGIGAAGTLKIAGTNAARTAASDAAKAAILAAGWTLEVNE